MFQSLFYWNLLSYMEAFEALSMPEQSFNPCFTGTSSHTKAMVLQAGMDWKVSILVLLEPPLILSEARYNFRLFKSVSILVLLEPPLIPTRDLSHGPSIIVSILVLLEPPLIPVSLRATSLILLVSILVLLEPPLIHGWKPQLRYRMESFNPCFTGTSSHTNLLKPSSN